MPILPHQTLQFVLVIDFILLLLLKKMNNQIFSSSVPSVLLRHFKMKRRGIRLERRFSIDASQLSATISVSTFGQVQEKTNVVNCSSRCCHHKYHQIIKGVDKPSENNATNVDGSTDVDGDCAFGTTVSRNGIFFFFFFDNQSFAVSKK